MRKRLLLSALAISASGAPCDAGIAFTDEHGQSIRFSGYMQMRYGIATAEDGEREDQAAGFDLRRLRLNLQGTAPDGALDWRVATAPSPRTGTFVVSHAYARYRFAEGWWVRAGNFRSWYARGWNLGGKNQLTADRPLLPRVFGQGNSEGVEVAYSADHWRWRAAITDGFYSSRTGLESPREADFSVQWRGEWKTSEPTWRSFDSTATSFRGERAGALFGVAGVYQTGGDTADPSGDVDRVGATADASLRGDGWQAQAEIYFQQDGSDPDAGPHDDWGLGLQAAAYLTDATEPFVRWDYLRPDSGRGNGGGELQVLTAGANYYPIPESTALRFTLDGSITIGSPEGARDLVGNLGYLSLPSYTGDRAFSVRAQVQLVF